MVPEIFFPGKPLVSQITDLLGDENDESLCHLCKGEPKYGDVVFCKRMLDLYRHFGIYIGKHTVIHFAPEDGDIGSSAVVHKVSLKEFAEGDDVYVMDFTDTYKSKNLVCSILYSSDYQLYTPRQTVIRAKKMLGKRGVNDDGYNLALNNCETFAIWCKTNVAESKQVQDVVNKLLGLAVLTKI